MLPHRQNETSSTTTKSTDTRHGIGPSPFHGRRGLPRHYPRHPEKGVDDKPDSGLIPLTVDEIRKLFNRIAAPIQHTVAHT